MDQTIAFATPADEEELSVLLQDTDMGLAGYIGEHVVLRRGKDILAGGCLYQAEEDLFHLLVFAVAEAERGRGAGQRLLREMSAHPWAYCLGAIKPPGGSYRITTVAKGAAAAFYRKSNYQACDFSQVPVPFDSQCGDCPERTECKPVPLVFAATIP
jgi:N-acetylglutamate synthase-like GNAT family acetyltransferase